MWFHAILVAADFLSVIVDYTTAMLMMSSILFQHAAKMLPGPPAGVCRVTVGVSLLAMEGFLEESVCLSSRLSLHNWIQTKPFFSWMYSIFGASDVEHLAGFLRHISIRSHCVSELCNLPSAKSTTCWLPCFGHGWIHGHKSLRCSNPLFYCESLHLVYCLESSVPCLRP